MIITKQPTKVKIIYPPRDTIFHVYRISTGDTYRKTYCTIDPRSGRQTPLTNENWRDRDGQNSRGNRRNQGGRGGRQGDGRLDGFRDPYSGRDPQRNDRLPTFTGDTADMNSHVFHCWSEITDPTYFSVTLKKLSYYMSKVFIFAANLDPIFRNFTTPIIDKPFER